MSPTATMTAPQIRALIPLVATGDLRQVPDALATTGARTEQARAGLRAAIARREEPLTWRRGGAPAPQIVARDLARAGEPFSPAKRRVYSIPEHPEATLAAIREHAAKRLAAERLAPVKSAVLAAYDRCSYRTAQGTWAGGAHKMAIRLCAPNEAPSASGESLPAWSRNGKWSGKDSSHTIVVQPTWPAIQASAQVVSGLLTLEMGSIATEPGIFAACWAEQGRGFTLNVRHGYLVDVGTEAVAAWQHADTLRGARQMRQVARSPRSEMDIESLTADGLLHRARLRGDEIVTRDIAHDGGRGACHAGIRDWLAKRGLIDRETMTARELADLAVTSHDRVREVYAILLATRRAARAGRAVAA